jgi:predicted metal-dependent enzyme (double-stranded beta helix superfamily)
MQMFLEGAELRPAGSPLRTERLSDPSQRLRMFSAIGRIVRSGADLPDSRVAEVLTAYAAIPDLLDGLDCTPSPERYVRVLLNEARTHCVMAVVWSPGQMSPVHAHRTWCALAVHRGALTEIHFEHTDDGLRATGAHLLRSGAFSHEPGRKGIHRVANLGVEVAISLHVYGTSYDRLGLTVNDVLAP